MLYDLINIAGLAIIGYTLWRQQQRIEDAEMMIGYTLSLIDDEEEEDVSSNHQA